MRYGIWGIFLCLVKKVPLWCFWRLPFWKPRCKTCLICHLSNFLLIKMFYFLVWLSLGGFFLRFYFIFSFIFNILVFIAAQLFFFFVANVETACLVVGPISIVFNIVPYKISCGDCFKFSLYELFIAIWAVGKDSALYVCYPLRTNENIVPLFGSSVLFIRSFVGNKLLTCFSFLIFRVILYWILMWTIYFYRW